jgi:hypothetical protein
MKHLITETREGFLSILPLHTIKEVQNQFSELFPYLKMNFHRLIGNRAAGNRVLYTADVKMNDILPEFKGGDWKIRDSMTIAEFEKGLLDQFGLSVQILRKSGNLWLGTSRSNSWTLKEQNDHGREISPDPKEHPVKFHQFPSRRHLG